MESLSNETLSENEIWNLSPMKHLVFHWRKIPYFVFTYIFPLVLLFIS